jgi:hypothetical protein
MKWRRKSERKRKRKRRRRTCINVLYENCYGETEENKKKSSQDCR